MPISDDPFIWTETNEFVIADDDMFIAIINDTLVPEVIFIPFGMFIENFAIVLFVAFAIVEFEAMTLPVEFIIEIEDTLLVEILAVVIFPIVMFIIVRFVSPPADPK